MIIPDRLKPLFSLLERAYGWWLDELVEMLPDSLRKRLAPAPPRVVITVERAGLGLFRIRRKSLKPLVKSKPGLLGLHMPDWPKQIRAKLRSVRRVGVRVAPDLILRRTLEFPLAAEDHLSQALLLQMDRHVPIRLERAHIDTRVLARDPVAQRLDAELAVVQRSRIDPILEMLKGAGFGVESVGLADDPAEYENAINFLRDETRARQAQNRRANAALAGFALLLALAGATLIDLKRAVEVDALQTKIDTLAPSVEKARTLAAELRQLQEEQRLSISGKSELDPLKLLNDLSAKLPDETWLQQLELKRSTSLLRLTGFSNNATAVLSTIQGTPALTNVHLRGPVTRAQAGRERFAIDATLKREAKP